MLKTGVVQDDLLSASKLYLDLSRSQQQTNQKGNDYIIQDEKTDGYLTEKSDKLHEDDIYDDISCQKMSDPIMDKPKKGIKVLLCIMITFLSALAIAIAVTTFFLIQHNNKGKQLVGSFCMI